METDAMKSEEYKVKTGTTGLVLHRASQYDLLLRVGEVSYQCLLRTGVNPK